ncbi:hypothetical protein OH77DRAFT_956466 [Trametes cingulata]|nr:hypothetical protein OH77DRAFT_956466 [Trametes cingulata]
MRELLRGSQSSSVGLMVVGHRRYVLQRTRSRCLMEDVPANAVSYLPTSRHVACFSISSDNGKPSTSRCLAWAAYDYISKASTFARSQRITLTTT